MEGLADEPAFLTDYVEILVTMPSGARSQHCFPLGMDDTQLDYVFSSVRRVIELESILSGVNE
jgi:hypothetical protein